MTMSSLRPMLMALALCFSSAYSAETTGITSGSIYGLTAQCSDKNLAIDNGGTADGTPACQRAAATISSQQWQVNALNDGSYQLIAQVSGKALAVVDGSLVNGGIVHQWTIDLANPHQKWRIVSAGGGWLKLVSVASGKCLDVNGASTADTAKIQQWNDNGTSAQHWRFTLLSATGTGAIVTPGTYRLSAKHSGKILEVAANSLSNGGIVRQANDTGTDAQRWVISTPASDSHRLAAKHSGKVLDVSGVSQADGARVHQWTDGGAANQRWELSPIGGPWFTLKARHSGKFLQIVGAQTTSEAPAEQWTASGSDHQKWKLTSCYDITATAFTSLVLNAGDVVRVTPNQSGTMVAYESCGAAVTPPFAVTAGAPFTLPTASPGYFTYRTMSAIGVEVATLEATVVRTNLEDVAIADEYGYTRSVAITIEPAGAPITLASSNAAQLTVGIPTFSATTASFLVTARAGVNAHVLAQIMGPSGVTTISRRVVEGFSITTDATKAITVVKLLADGSQVGEANLAMAPLIPDLSVTLAAYSAGLTFENGSLSQTTATNAFFVSGTVGMYTYRVVRAPTGYANLCHTYIVYQNARQISRSH